MRWKRGFFRVGRWLDRGISEMVFFEDVWRGFCWLEKRGIF